MFIRLADRFQNHIGMVVNTDITTDLSDLTEIITVPFGSGTTVFMDESFARAGEGIVCVYDGRVKITTSLHVTSTLVRSNIQVDIAINEIPLGIIGASGYVRASAQDESSITVIAVANCNAGDIIEVLARQEGTGGAAIYGMAEVGSSMLLVERI